MVKSAPKRAEATDVAAQARGLESAIGALRSEMKRLEEAGQGGRFGDVGVPSERRAFLENVAKHRKEADAVGRLKQELLEARARGDTARASTIAAAMKSRQLEEQDYHDIVLRQKMIRGFWIEKTPQYVKKEAELQNLEARLKLLGV